MSTDAGAQNLLDRWSAAWPKALAAWSHFTRLSEPRWCLTTPEAAKEGLTASFAMIRLTDHAVVINLAQVQANGLEDFGLEILAHEIGHHIYCPADLTDNARMLARVRRGLPGHEQLAPTIANLYADLLINDRLQRGQNLRMAEIYTRLRSPQSSALWWLYMRAYEILWRLERGTLTAQAPLPEDFSEAAREGDAQLAARLIRVYSRNWLRGAGKFAVLCLPYVIHDQQQQEQADQDLRRWLDAIRAGDGAIPDGLTELDPDEISDVMHPAQDPELNGERDTVSAPSDTTSTQGSQSGQAREPFEYGELLKLLGVKLTEHEAAVRYYRERAIPHLIRFPSRELPESVEPQIEGLEPWDIGSPLDAADWFESSLVSPRVIPGFTTVQRVYGTTQGQAPEREPVDLDLYVDSSGSMPNPQHNVSYLTLAGAIVALSCLRAGGRVQATLWSGVNQCLSTEGFVRDETEILRVLTGFFGGGTAFPIHKLRDTYSSRTPANRPAHILIISDDGVTTMFDLDEKKNSGFDIAAMAMRAAVGGTMVLQIDPNWAKRTTSGMPDLVRAQREQGWQIHGIRNWDELVAFAREFSRKTYEPSPNTPPGVRRA